MRRFIRPRSRAKESWEISVDEADLLIITTRNGAAPQFETKACGSAGAARRMAEELIAARLAEGLVEVDAKGKAKAVKPKGQTEPRARRWEFRDRDRFRILVLDDERIVLGPPLDLECYVFDGAAEAAAYADGVIQRWRADSFRVTGPEEIPRSSLPTHARAARRAPNLDGPKFEGSVEVSASSAAVTLTRCEKRGGGASLAGFRDVLRRIRDAGSRRIVLEADDYLPEHLWMEAMGELQLPEVLDFQFCAPEFRRPELGKLSSLYTCCPRLVHVEIQGWGSFTPVRAEHLCALRIWDAHSERDAIRALGESDFPALQVLSIADEGGTLEDDAARVFFEERAPELQSIELDGFVESIDVLLTAKAPKLNAVTFHSHDLDDALFAVGERGIPAAWRKLELWGTNAELEDVVEVLEEHAAAFAHLHELRLGYEFDDPAAALRRLQELCPQLVALERE